MTRLDPLDRIGQAIADDYHRSELMPRTVWLRLDRRLTRRQRITRRLRQILRGHR